MAITGLTVTAEQVRQYNDLTADIEDSRIEYFIGYGLPDFIDYIGADNYDTLPLIPVNNTEEVRKANAEEAIINFTLAKLMPSVTTFTLGDRPDAQDNFRDEEMYAPEDQNENSDRFLERGRELADKVKIKNAYTRTYR